MREHAYRIFGVALGLIAAIAIVLLVLSLLSRDGESVVSKCQRSGELLASPPNATKLVELQANRARPTLTIALTDRESAIDDIFFSTKNREAIRGAIRAQLIEVPRRGAERAERIGGGIRVSATPQIGRTAVRLRACIDRGGLWKAGSYQGTVRIYGPQLSDFDYAIVVTQRWPWESAVLLLVIAGIAFFAVAFFTESLTFEHRKANPGTGKLVGSTVLSALVAIAAMTPTFWGTYWNNATWGSDPDAHISGIVAAGFTAGLAGLALAKRLLKPPAKPPSSAAE